MTPRIRFVLLVVLTIGAPLGAQERRQTPTPRVVSPAWVEVTTDNKTVANAPYSADITRETIQTLADGNRIVTRLSSRVYRDSVGRVRREDTEANGATVISITDPVARTVTTLNPTAKTAAVSRTIPVVMRSQRYTMMTKGGETWTMVTRGGQPAVSSLPDSATTTEEQLPEKEVQGVRATGVRKTTTIPAGAVNNEKPIRIVMEEWTAVDLQVLVSSDYNDPRTTRTTYSLSNISRAEPAASLFVVPSGYRIVTRSAPARGK